MILEAVEEEISAVAVAAGESGCEKYHCFISKLRLRAGGFSSLVYLSGSQVCVSKQPDFNSKTQQLMCLNNWLHPHRQSVNRVC